MSYSTYNYYDKENYGLNTPEYKEWHKNYVKMWREKNKDYVKQKYQEKYSQNVYCETCQKEVSILNKYHFKSKKHLEKINEKKNNY